MRPVATYEIGTVLVGKYRVVGVLGTGGMGTVYDVVHEQIGKRRALKILHPREELSTEAVHRFQREMKADAVIQNAHIVEVFDAGELEADQPYVVMERLDGQTLSDWLRCRAELRVDEICDLVAQACEGVQAAHDAGIIHRDLKPANLFVTMREGKPFVKILDFGIAKFSLPNADDFTVTREGVLVGTPCYMAPEQIRGQTDLDRRVDVYALGVILYESVAGRVPYRADSLAHLGALVCEGKPTPLRAINPAMPQFFCDVVARAMAVDRANRFGTAGELGAVLWSIANRADSDALITREFIRDTCTQNVSTPKVTGPLDLPRRRASLELPPVSTLRAFRKRHWRPLLVAGTMIALLASMMTALLVSRINKVEQREPVVFLENSSAPAEPTISEPTNSAPVTHDSARIEPKAIPAEHHDDFPLQAGSAGGPRARHVAPRPPPDSQNWRKEKALEKARDGGIVTDALPSARPM